jgi:hypothetical protein
MKTSANLKRLPDVIRRTRRTFSEVRPRRHALTICSWINPAGPDPADWIRFHLRLGVDHIFLYFRNPSDAFLAALQPWIAARALTPVPWDGPPRRKSVYRHFLKHHARLCRWTAFLHPTDYLFSPRDPDLRSVLDRFDDYAGVCVYPLDFSRFPPTLDLPDLPTPMARTLRSERELPRPCRILNPKAIRRVAPSGRFVLRGGRQCVDERCHIEADHQPFVGQWLRVHHYGIPAPHESAAPADQSDDRTGILDGSILVRMMEPPAPRAGRFHRPASLGAPAALLRATARAADAFRLNLPRRYYLTACLVFRNAAPYLCEWLEFHRIVGFEHFYLYDDNSDDDPDPILAPYLRKRLVTCHRLPRAGAPDTEALFRQYAAFRHCFETYGKLSRWTAFIDDDEFLFPTSHWTMNEALGDYERFAGIAIPWLLFGSSGHRTAPAGLVIEHFRRRQSSVHEIVKCVLDPARISEVLTPHSFRLAGGTLPVDETERPRAFHHSPANSVDTFRINHYFTKSHEESGRKNRRGYFASASGTFEEKRVHRLAAALDDKLNAVEDLTIQRYLLRLREAVDHPAA